MEPKQIVSMVDMPLPTEREVIAAYLEAAARILRKHKDGSRDASVAWRVADAGLLLRNMIAESGVDNVQGVNIPTGRGAMLPTIWIAI